MNLFCGGKFSDRVSSEKLLAVSAAGPPAAFFPEIDMSGFFGHVHFGKKCDFAQIWSKYPPRYSKRLPGSSLEGLRGLSGDSLRPSVSPRPIESTWRRQAAATPRYQLRDILGTRYNRQNPYSVNTVWGMMSHPRAFTVAPTLQ